MKANTYPTISNHKLHNTNENKFPVFPECIYNKWQNMMSGTQPRKNMKTMGKVDTSDLMMILTWAIDVSFQSPYLNGPVEHIQPHVL